MTFSSSQYLLDSSREFAIYVCETRSIPRITDSLKDSQRKALWVVRNRTDKTKTISLAGDMISEGLYLHGDASAANAISMMAAKFCNNVPLLEGIGQFGSRVNPTGWAAPRYTYVKPSAATRDLIYPDADIIPVRENYDGSTIEPVTFLPIIPMVLLNGISGMGVGWSTEILPRSLSDIIQGTLSALSGQPVAKLKPSFAYSTCDVTNVKENVWEFTGKIRRLSSTVVEITDIPPGMNLEKVRETLNDLEETHDAVNGYQDNSTSAISISVKFKRGELERLTDEQLLTLFKLRSRKTERIVVIDWDGQSIRQYQTAEEIFPLFVEWRLNFYRKRYENLLAHDTNELNFWKAVVAAFKGRYPSSVMKKANKSEALDLLAGMVKTPISDQQMDKIVNLPTYRWTDEYRIEAEGKITHYEKQLQEWQSFLNDEAKLRGQYRKELLALRKKYAI